MKNEKIISSFNTIFESTKSYNETGEFPYEIFQTPFCNLTIDTAAFQEIWLKLFPFFMNTNVNSLDLFVSTQGEIIDAYMIKATADGLLEALIPINKKEFAEELIDISLTQNNNLNLSKGIYEKLAPKIKKKYQISLGNIRIYSQTFITRFLEINHAAVSQNVDLIETIIDYFLLFLKARGNDRFFDFNDICFDCFPATDFTRFLDGLAGTFKKKINSKIKESLKLFLKSCIPQKKFTVSFQTERQFFSFLIDSHSSPFLIRYLPINLAIKADFSNKFTRRKIYLKKLRKQYHFKQNFLYDFQSLVKLIELIIQSPFPLTLLRMEQILQYLLNFYRSYGFDWEVAPNPIIINETVRYWQYTFGIRLNMRKIAYWFVPRFIITSIFEPIGTDGKILLITGPNFESLHKTGEFSDKHHYLGFLCEFESNKLISVHLIPKYKLKQKSDIMKRQTPRSSNAQEVPSDLIQKKDKKRLNGNLTRLSFNLLQNLNPEYGSIYSFHWISTELIQNFLQTLQFSIFSPMSRYWFHLKNLIKACQKPYNLWCMPKNRAFRFLHTNRPAKYLKSLIPLVIEQHEF